MHLFHNVIAHIELILAQGGYWVVGIASILEGLPLVGSAIPGHTIIIFAGFLARTGVLHIVPITLLAALGAIAGDVIAFYIGVKYGYGFLDRFSRYFFISPEHIEKAKKVIEKHTGKALIFGRFNPVTRALTPFLVGASRVEPAKFWTYDIIGATSWAVISIGIGYMFGASYHVAAGYFGKFVLAALVIAVLIVWGYRFINVRWHIFVKRHFVVLIVNLIFLYIFFKTVQDSVVFRSFFINTDVSMNIGISSLVVAVGQLGTVLTQVMNSVTVVAGPIVAPLILGTGIIWYALQKAWQKVLLLSCSLVGILVSVPLIKELVMRVRPDNAYIAYADFSFPSFHAAMAATLATLAIYLYSRTRKSSTMRILSAVGFIIASAILAFSRLYLNVHWLSDVIAGYALGVFWATGMILFVKYLSTLIWGKSMIK